MSSPYPTPDPAVLGPALAGTVPAPVGRRMGASILDSLFATLPVVLLYVVVLAARDAAGFLGIALVALPMVLAVLQWVWHATTGQTVGKRATGIRTVAVPGGTVPGASRTFGRASLLSVVGVLPFGSLLFVLSIFWDPTGLRRAWHDKASNVFLIDIRNGRDPAAAGSRPGTVTMPVGAGAPARTLEPPAVPAGPRGSDLPAPAVPAGPRRSDLPAPAVPSSPAVAVAELSAVVPAETVVSAWAGDRPLVVASTPAGADGLIAPIPGFSPNRVAPAPAVPAPAAASPAPSSAAPAAPTRGSAPRVPYSPLPAPPNDDDLDATVMSVGAGGLQLLFDSGDALPVNGRGRIGRDPAQGDEPLAHLVPLPDTTKSISKTHLEFSVAGDTLWVADLHSTNGVSIEDRGATVRLTPGEWARAEVGATVRFGSRSFRVAAS